MFSHIMLGANDVDASKAFYDATLHTLGHAPGVVNPAGVCFYFTDTGVFAVTKPIDGQPASKGNGSTIGFAAKTIEDVEAWHTAGLANGGALCEDPPGIRESGNLKMYIAYLLDPAGNKVCALHHMR